MSAADGPGGRRDRGTASGVPRPPTDAVARSSVDAAPDSRTDAGPRPPTDAAPRSSTDAAPRPSVDSAPRSPTDAAPRSPTDGVRRSPIDAALKLLAARSRTEAELRRALETKGYAPAETLAALARVRELGYLDDGEVASARARSLLERGASPRSAVRRLEEQGIDGAQARRAVDGQTGEGGEDALLRRALERRLKGRAAFGAGSARDGQPQAAESIDLAEKKRLFRSLVQKGFSPAAVARELGIPGDFDDDHET